MNSAITNDKLQRELESFDLRGALYHEAGHYIVARHFGSRSNFMVWKNENPNEGDKYWIGQHRMFCSTPFRQACVGWAGNLAEEVATGSPDDETNVIDAETMVDFLDWDTELSATDRKCIESHPQKWRACKTAAEILNRNRAELHRIVEYCLNNRRYDQIVYGEDV